MNITAEEILQNKGVKPTPNRLLVLNALLHAENPMSLSDLELELLTIEKSSIFRVLTLFTEHDITHLLEGGDGITKYEVCHGEDCCTIDDMHVHFYCMSCHRTYCLKSIPVPQVIFPEGYEMKSTNYLAKGICPKCGKRRK